MRWVSLGTLVVAGVVLGLFWGEIPDRWVIHWGLHDRANGWATKSVGAAAAPLVIGLVAWLVTEGAAVGLKSRGIEGSATTRAPEWVAVQATVVRAVGLAMALLTAGLALALPLLRPRSHIPITVAAAAELGLVIGAAMVWAWRRTRRLRAAGVSVPEGYAGAFYRNPRDPRLWVPKLSGMGWTINFSHRYAWPVMLALIGVPIGIVLLLLVALPAR